jgi:cytochrome c5
MAMLPACWLLVCSPGLASQGIARGSSIWDGVFTAEQTARGKATYAARCTSCHGSEMNANAASLTGDKFWQRWTEDSLESLFAVIQGTMPGDSPSALTDEEYADIVAYLLAANGVLPGSRELARNDIPNIRVQGKDGPGPVPNFSLIRVVGCLQHPADELWLLTDATDPVRTRNPMAETSELHEGAGSGRFELMSIYPKPDSREGQMLLVKGFLVRNAQTDRLNVTSWTPVSSTCRQNARP